MRLWKGEGGLMTDEQLLRTIAHYGSLDAARAAGNVILVSDGREQGPENASRDGRARRAPRLSDYLEGEDGH